ncbi:hypothetical protein ACFO6Q_13200 [Dokdonella ginsengisoli]|uniref:Uncharacterized protein n=1 Tax=Dokdonella ginsengisoli TaxID=363846 RepID=A0ABV9QVD7_9GAMM
MQRPGTKNHDAIADALAPVRRTLTNDASIERSRRHRSCLLLAGVPISQKSDESGQGSLRAPSIAGAPDIIEKVTQGRQPVGFAVKSLKRFPPLDWDKQRRLYCMSR